MQRVIPVEKPLQSACASIRYRIRRELLNEIISPEELKAFQEQILQDDTVREVINSQSPDGWFGKTFHGYNSHEAGIRLLCEKGVSPQQPFLSRALLAMQTNSDRIAREMRNAGKILDDMGFGGAAMIQATVFAYAGMENKKVVQGQIKVALEGFQNLLSISSVGEIAEPYKGRLVFRPSVRWPGIYHLRLLAFTHAWRSPRNQAMVAGAIKRLVTLSPIPHIKVRYKSQLIAPPAFAMQDFNPKMASMDASQWMMWFHRMELVARLGVAGMITELQSQLDMLRALLDEGEGWFTKPISHAYFKRWGAYTGLMLEQDWRSPQRRIYDLTFRSMLIQEYSKNKV